MTGTVDESALREEVREESGDVAVNLCADKLRVFAEIWRVLRLGGRLRFADIANGRPLPASAAGGIDLWTA